MTAVILQHLFWISKKILTSLKNTRISFYGKSLLYKQLSLLQWATYSQLGNILPSHDTLVLSLKNAQISFYGKSLLYKQLSLRQWETYSQLGRFRSDMKTRSYEKEVILFTNNGLSCAYIFKSNRTNKLNIRT